MVCEILASKGKVLLCHPSPLCLVFEAKLGGLITVRHLLYAPEVSLQIPSFDECI